MPDTTPDDLLAFWFIENGQEQWFAGGPEFDAQCERFRAVWEKAIRAELWAWRATLRGRLAEIVLLDQFSRQLNRGSATAFAADTMAVALAQEVVATGRDKDLSTDERAFLYLPYEHAESIVLQDESVRLYTELGEKGYLDYAIAHHEVIARFSRFPMRNAALGRASTPEEIAYIESRKGESSF